MTHIRYQIDETNLQKIGENYLYTYIEILSRFTSFVKKRKEEEEIFSVWEKSMFG